MLITQTHKIRAIASMQMNSVDDLLVLRLEDETISTWLALSQQVFHSARKDGTSVAKSDVFFLCSNLVPSLQHPPPSSHPLLEACSFLCLFL